MWAANDPWSFQLSLEVVSGRTYVVSSSWFVQANTLVRVVLRVEPLVDAVTRTPALLADGLRPDLVTSYARDIMEGLDLSDRRLVALTARDIGGGWTVSTARHAYNGVSIEPLLDSGLHLPHLTELCTSLTEGPLRLVHSVVAGVAQAVELGPVIRECLDSLGLVLRTEGVIHGSAAYWRELQDVLLAFQSSVEELPDLFDQFANTYPEFQRVAIAFVGGRFRSALRETLLLLDPIFTFCSRLRRSSTLSDVRDALMDVFRRWRFRLRGGDEALVSASEYLAQLYRRVGTVGRYAPVIPDWRPEAWDLTHGPRARDCMYSDEVLQTNWRTVAQLCLTQQLVGFREFLFSPIVFHLSAAHTPLSLLGRDDRLASLAEALRLNGATVRLSLRQLTHSRNVRLDLDLFSLLETSQLDDYPSLRRLATTLHLLTRWVLVSLYLGYFLSWIVSDTRTLGYLGYPFLALDALLTNLLPLG